jgi:hypothetical protein
MTLPVFAAGEKPTAAKLYSIYTPVFIRKSAPESVTSSTTLQDDNDFSVTLSEGTYLVWMWAHTSGAAAGDFKVAWANTGTMTITRSTNGPTSGTTDRSDTNVSLYGTAYTTAITYGLDGSGTSVVREELMVIVTATGDLTMQWAQGSSSGTATTMSSASRMLVLPVA